MASPAVTRDSRPRAELARPATLSPRPPFRLAWLFSSSEGHRPREEHRQHRILLIEDDPDIAQMYKLALRHAGLDLTVASDGALGLEELRNHRYRLVLLDLGLPRQHGFEVLDQIRSDSSLGHPTVLIVSNYSEESTVREGMARGLPTTSSSRTSPRVS